MNRFLPLTILPQSVIEMTNYTFCQGNGVTAPEEKRTDR